jgi:anti-sigma B factor antagonist
LLPEQESSALASVSVSTREYGGHTVVALCGELDAVDAASVMTVLVSAVVRGPLIIVDLAALEFIDCCALGVLARVRAQARQAGGDVLLAAPRRYVRRILTLTGLTGLFSVHASVDDAVRTARRCHLMADPGRRRGLRPGRPHGMAQCPGGASG